MNRRFFITNSFKLALGISMELPTFSILKSFNSSSTHYNSKIIPPLLRTGDTIAITAPASGCTFWELQPTVNFFKKMNCNVVIGDTIINRNKNYRYLSNDDKTRAQEFQEFVKNPGVRAIIAARGGYGSIRLLNHLDYNLILQDPKIYLGFSDITILLNTIHSKTGIITYHGPVANYKLNSFSQKILKTLLFYEEFEKSEKITYKFTKQEILSSGIARGELIGGNLTSLVSLLGTEYDFDTTNKILFFEEVSEHPYKIDRMLKHLELAGKFQNIKGIVIGYMGSLDNRRNFFPDYSFTLREILKMNLSELGIPILINFPFGHSDKFFTFPIGFEAEINCYTLEFSLILPSRI
ncbi:MAG: S66 peptidase family protein [Candidatus Kapaibacteriales bacterium]